MEGTIKKIIFDLEKKWPVDEWKVAGIHIWPFVRIKIFIHFYRKKTGSCVKPTRVGGVKFLRKAKIPYELLKASITLLIFYNRLKPKKLIFFGSHIHRSKQEGKYFNRFFDSMIDHHNLEDDVYILEFQKFLANSFNQQAVVPLHYYLNEYKLVQEFLSRFKFRKSDISLNDYNNFLEDLFKKYPPAKSLQLSIEDIIRWAEKINKTAKFFIKLYKITTPEKVILSSYYGFDDLAAAIFAAHQLGIKTVDFQHGPQRNFNLAYSAWNKIPPDLYNTMPIEYWNWDEDSKKNIDQWARKTNISTKVIGQPYLSYWLQKYNEVDQKINQSICYSLQPTIEGVSLKDFFPDKLVELIKDSPYTWVLRLHPRSNYNKSDIIKLLDLQNVENSKYYFEEATETPLPQTLGNSILHITNWSGCLIEARMLGVPSICLHPLSLQLYSEYIDNHLVCYLKPDEPSFAEEFNSFLNYISNKKFSNRILSIPNPLHT